MATIHPWKFVDPKRTNPNRKGMLLSNEIDLFRQNNLLVETDFTDKNLRPAAYTLRIGKKFIDSEGKPGELSEKNLHFTMEPNSIVYVSTFEKLNLPYYIAARFNLRVKWVYKGILLGTGPQVEPGYRGYLSCPLYNLTSSPIRITYQEDFATIDFERTTDFCPDSSAEEISQAIEHEDEFDKLKLHGQSYVLFKQKEYPALKLYPGFDVLSSLAEMEQEVRTWRHIGIAFAVSFFALTLTLLGFGSSVLRQTNDFTNEVRLSRVSIEKADSERAKTLQQLEDLRRRVSTAEQTLQRQEKKPSQDDKK